LIKPHEEALIPDVKIKERQRALPGLIAQEMEELIILSNCCGY
jgi:hypothetical protein